MIELLNIRFSFFLRSDRKNELGEHTVVFRITYRNARRDLFTGLYCSPKAWDRNNGLMTGLSKPVIAFNKNLDLIVQKANEIFQELRYAGPDFTMDELVNKIKGKDAVTTLLIEHIVEVTEKIKLRVGVDITPATHQKYNRTLRHLKAFLEKMYKVKNFALKSIDRKFVDQYFYYLRTDCKMAHNTSIKNMQFLKTLLFPAIKSGALPVDPFLDLKLKSKAVFKEVLTTEDIENLMNAELSSNSLIQVRDIFVFACFTGLAYIDLKNLNRTDIIKDKDNSWHIRKPRQKTGQESIIPLLPPAYRILEKYSPTGDIRDFMWHIASNQKMNFYLKELAEKIGIEKKLHMHLARHSFAPRLLYQTVSP